MTCTIISRTSDRGPVLPKSSKGKKYPDFVVSAYYGRDYKFERELARAAEAGNQAAIQRRAKRSMWMKPQVPRLVFEIGTLDRGQKVGSDTFKQKVFDQLSHYMHRVAGPSQKWTEIGRAHV